LASWHDVARSTTQASIGELVSSGRGPRTAELIVGKNDAVSDGCMLRKSSGNLTLRASVAHVLVMVGHSGSLSRSRGTGHVGS